MYEMSELQLLKQKMCQSLCSKFIKCNKFLCVYFLVYVTSSLPALNDMTLSDELERK
jgi:hypothetical protein